MATAFHDIRFPFPLAFGAAGGPVRQTDIVQLANGFETRNTAHRHSRRQYTINIGIKSLDELADLINFFEARRGALYGFRFNDPLDNKSCLPSQTPKPDDQFCEIGDGKKRRFQLIKRYGDAKSQWQRVISKPIASTVRMAVNGQEQSASDFSVNDNSGIVTFDTAPSPGARIESGYEYDVPVRFDNEQISTSLEGFGAGGVVDLRFVEIRYA